MERCVSLLDMSVLITSSLERGEVLQRIMEQATTILQCSRASILLIDETAGVLRFSILSEQSEGESLSQVEIHPGEGIAGQVWQTGEAVLIGSGAGTNHVSQRVDDLTSHKTVSLMAAPLISRNRTIGVMEAVSNDPEKIFTRKDLEFFKRMAGVAAIAIENSILYEQAIKDPLTDLFIRRYFEETLETEIDRSKRYNRPISLVLFDLDHFKKINDTYGHAIGDDVLKVTSRLLMKNCRSTDAPCRFGGEEFIVLLPETDCNQAMIFAERFRRDLEAEVIQKDSLKLQITVSGGISCARGDDLDPYRLFQQADSSLYASKNAGRNRITIFQSEKTIG